MNPFVANQNALVGIHGMPKRPWDGVDGKDLSYDEDSGYCAHSTERFPTWHRPYIAMMEVSSGNLSDVTFSNQE